MLTTGWNYVYDRLARNTANNGLGERVARTTPPGPTVAFLHDLLKNSSVEIISGYLAVPRSGRSRTGDHQLEVQLVGRHGDTMVVRADYVVDGTPEAYGLQAFDLPFRLGREGKFSPSRYVFEFKS